MNPQSIDRSAVNRDIRGHLILLGTGTSVGVPTIGCPCAVCTSGAERNQRTRCSAIVGLPGGNLLIDTTPEMRLQLLRERIGRVDAVAYTHEHADHLMGLDDLRIFPFYLGHPVPLYCTAHVAERIRHMFDYAFADRELTHAGAAPQLSLIPIDTQPFEVLGAIVQPVRLLHGPHFEVLGFRVGDVAYCTDTNGIPDESWPLLAGLDVIVLGALRHKHHPTHFSLDEAIEAARRIGARQTYFTHTSHDLDYATTNALLSASMQLAYDGLDIPISGLQESSLGD